MLPIKPIREYAKNRLSPKYTQKIAPVVKGLPENKIKYPNYRFIYRS
jgi:hypothetical protein